MRTSRQLSVPLLIAAATVLVNCGEHQGVTAPDGVTISVPGVYAASALEAAHHPSFARLYFLPPMVKRVPFEGAFDATLVEHIAVELCRAEGSTCVTEPVALMGEGADAGIKIDAEEEHYSLNWRVGGPGIAAGDYRLNVRLGAVVIGGVGMRLGSKPQDLRELPDDVVGVQLGRMLPIKFRIERATDAVVSIRLDPATATTVIGATMPFTATVFGADGTPRPGETVTWTSSDESVATVDANGLATGVAVGNATITAAAAGLSATSTLQVLAPDLRIATLTAPTSIVLGDALAVDAVVSNAGDSDAAAARVRFRILNATNGEEVAAVSVEQPALAAGATAPVTASFTPDLSWPRAIVVEATADADATIAESSESNNGARSPDIAFVAPDLTVAIAPPGGSVLAGSTLTLSVTTTNAGTSPADASNLRVRVINPADGSELSTLSHPTGEIAADEAEAASLTIPVAFEWPSPIAIEVTADADAAVTEWDEANNVARSADILVTRPDLHVAAVSVPASVPAGSALAVTATVKNLGTGAAAATDIRFRVLNAATSEEVATSTIAQGAIDAGSVLDATASFATTAQWPRDVRVEVMTDASAAVRESDETNNVGSSTAVGITLPDLKVTAVEAPGSVPAGGTFTAKATIANAGTADAAAAQARLRVLDASNGNEVASIVQPQAAIPAGASADISADFASTRDWPRQVVVEVTADVGGAIAELDETNNVARSGTIGLTDPDLIVSSVTFSATTIGLRCSLGIQAVVRNAGSGSAPAGNLRFSLQNGEGAVVAFIVVTQPALAAGAEATVTATFIAGSDWPGEVAGRAEADAANTIPETDETNNVGIAAVLVQARTTVPVGYHKMWVCGSSTSWTDGSNWQPAGAPVSGQNVYVPAGVNQYPVLGGAQTVNDLLIDLGASVNIGAHNLTATGNVISGTMLGSTGELMMTGAAKTVRGTVPNLDIHGSIALSGDASASRIIVNAGRSLNINGFTQNVTGDVTVVGTTSTVHHLVLPSGTSRLVVGRNLTIGGATALTAGVIHVRGGFLQNGATNSVTPTGTQFIFDGTDAQNVHFSHLRTSWLRDVVIRGAAVNFTNHLSIAGQLDVAPGGVVTQSGGNTYYSARVPSEADAGSYRVPTSVVDGTVLMVRDVSLQASNASIVVDPGHQLNLDGHTLVVGGNVVVAGTTAAADHILMATGNPRLEVRGNMTVGGRTKLDVGTIVLRGDFLQNGATNSMIPTGTKMVLDGPAKHTVHFSHLRTSWFGDVEVRTPAEVSGVDFTNHLSIRGQLVVAEGALVTQSGGNTYYVNRVPEELWAAGYRVPTSVIDGPAVMVRNIALASPVANIVVEPGHTLTIGEYTLDMAGNFTVAGTTATAKHVVMTHPSGVMKVRSMTVGGATQLDAGAIHVRGDFLQNGATNALTTGGTRFIFDGAGPQAVHFSHLRTSWFRDVTVRGPAVNFTNHLSIFGQLDVAAGGIVTQSGGNTYYTLRVPTEAVAGSYRVPTSVIDGQAAMVQDVALTAGNASIVVEPGHQLNLAGRSLIVGGNFTVTGTTSATDHVLMATGAPRLEVRGQMTVGGRTKLDVGTVVVRGGFLQNGATNSLIPTGTTFVFEGAASQNVHFSHLFTSWLGDVEIRGPVNFTNHLAIAGQLTVFGNGRLTQTGGNTYYTRRIPDPTTGSFEVPTSVVAGPVVMTHNITWPHTGANLVVDPGHSLNVNGHTLHMAGNFTVVGTTSTALHLVMPSATSRLLVRDMTVGGRTQLDAGAIHVRGDFLQNGATNALTTGGTLFVFDGPGAQNVHFSHLRTSWLRDVEIRGPAVNFTNHLSIAGQLDVAAGGVVTQSGGNAYYSSRVPREAAAARYRVPTSVIDGHVALVGDVALTAANASIVVEPGHQLNLAGFGLILGGNFTVAGTTAATDHLLMASGAPRLEVRGQMTVGGRTRLDVGAIVLKGNFLQNGATNSMIPTGTRVVFDGAGSAHFSHPGSSWFGTVEVTPGAVVNTTNSTLMKGNLQLNGALTTVGTTTVQGTFFWAGALTQNGFMTVGACSKLGGTFAGTGNNPCP